MLYTVSAPNGKRYQLEGPEGLSEEELLLEVANNVPDALLPPKQEDTTGFKAAAVAGWERLKGEAALTAGKAGLLDEAEAQRIYQEREAAAQKRFTPTEDGWAESPWQKLKETAGGSLPYMALPAAVGIGAAAAAPATVAGVAGAGLAGLASLGQFTGSNLARQVEQGKTLEEASGAAAVAAAIPQAALDVVSLRMLPGIGRIFGAAGKEVTEETAKAIASQAIRQKARDYISATGKAMTVEGLTEAGQQVLERMQAGLDIADPEARDEYFESFIGGAALAGAISPVGRYVERGRIKDEGRRLEQTRLGEERAAAQEQARQEALVQAEKDRQAQAFEQQDLFAGMGASEENVLVQGPPVSREAAFNETEQAVLAQIRAQQGDAAANAWLQQRATAATTPEPEPDVLNRQLEQLQGEIAFASEQGDQNRVNQLTDRIADVQDRLRSLDEGATAFDQQRTRTNLSDLLDSLRTQIAGTQDPAEKLRLAKIAQATAAQIKTLPADAGEAAAKLTKSLKTKQKALDKASEDGDYDAVAKLVPQIQSLQEQLAKVQVVEEPAAPQQSFPQEQWDLFGGKAEDLAAWNQRTMLPELERQREELAQQRAAEAEQAKVDEERYGLTQIAKAQELPNTAAQAAQVKRTELAQTALVTQLRKLAGVREKEERQTAEEAADAQRRAAEHIRQYENLQWLDDPLLGALGLHVPMEERTPTAPATREDDLFGGEATAGQLPLPKEVTSDLEANIARAKTVSLTDEERNIVERIEDAAPTLRGMAVEKPTDVMRNKALVPLLRAVAVAQGKVAQAQNYVRAVETAVRELTKTPLTKAQRKKADASPEGRVEVIQKRRAKLAEKQAQLEEKRAVAQAQLKAAQEAVKAPLAALNKAVGEARQGTVTDIPADVNDWLGSVAEGRVTPEDTARVTQQLGRLQRLGEAGDIRQAELPLTRQGKPDTLAMVFKSIKDFNTFLASNALDRLRKEEFGWNVRPTLARVMRKLEGLPERIAAATDRVKKARATRENFEQLKTVLVDVQEVATADRFQKDKAASVLETLRQMQSAGRIPSDLYNAARGIVEGRRDLFNLEQTVDGAQARIDAVNKDIQANIDALDAKIAFEPARKKQVQQSKSAFASAYKKYEAAKERLNRETENLAQSEAMAADYDVGSDTGLEAARKDVAQAFSDYSQARSDATSAGIAKEAAAKFPKLSNSDFAAALEADARLFDELRSARGRLSQAKGQLRRAQGYVADFIAGTGIDTKLAAAEAGTERARQREKAAAAEQTALIKQRNALEAQKAPEPTRVDEERVARGEKERAANEQRKEEQARAERLGTLPKETVAAKKVADLEGWTEIGDIDRLIDVANTQRNDYIALMREQSAKIGKAKTVLEQQTKRPEKERDQKLIERQTKIIQDAESTRTRVGNKLKEANVALKELKELRAQKVQRQQERAAALENTIDLRKQRLDSAEEALRTWHKKNTSEDPTILLNEKEKARLAAVRKRDGNEAADKLLNSLVAPRKEKLEAQAKKVWTAYNRAIRLYNEVAPRPVEADPELMQLSGKWGVIEKLAQMQAQQKTAAPLVKHVRTQRVSQAAQAPGKRAISKKEMAAINKKAAEFAKQKAEIDEQIKTGTLDDYTDESFGDILDDSFFDFRETDQAYADRETAPLSDTAVEALEAGDLDGALADLEKNGSTPFVRELASRLREQTRSTTVKVDDDVTAADGSPLEGLYAAKPNRITLNRAFLNEGSVAHEATHAATVASLDADPDTLSAEQQKARSEVEALYQKAQADKAFADEYGIKNVKEFVAEVMANKNVRDKLDAMPQGFLRKLYNALLRMIGMTPKSVSEKAVEDIYKLFSPAQAVETSNAVYALEASGVFPGRGAKFNANIASDVADIAGKIVGGMPSLGDKVGGEAFGLRMLRMRTKIADRFAPIEALVKRGVEKGKIEATQALQTMMAVRVWGHTTQLGQMAMTRGVPQFVKDPDSGVKVIESVAGANMQQVAEALKKANVGNVSATEQLFTTWLAVLRAEKDGIGYDKLNTKAPLADADAAKIKAAVENNPQTKEAFDKARKIYHEYNKNLLNFVVESGALSREKADELLQGDYVPYYRERGGVVEMVGVSGKPVWIGNLVDQPHLKELVGGDEKILPIFNGAAQNTMMLINMATKNAQTHDVANMLQDLGLGQILPEDEKNSSGMFRVRFKYKGNDYWLKIDEEAFPSDIPADVVVMGLQGIKTATPALVKLMRYPVQFLRRNITRVPVYAMRQVIRDSTHAWMTTGTDSLPILKATKEFGSLLKGTSETGDILKRAGAISSNVYGDENEIADMLRRVVTGEKGWQKWLARLDQFALNGDSATRVVLYDDFRKKGLSHAEALLYTAESMNFGRTGTSASLHWLSSMVPFFHAQLVGLDAVWRSGWGNVPFEEKMNARNVLLKRGALMFAGTMAYAALMQDDEAYKNATPEERAASWFVRIPGSNQSVRIPIPFELGLAFKVLPELIYNTMAGDTKFGTAAKTFGKQLINTIPGGGVPIPTIVRGPVELVANYNFFTNAPIISQREKLLEASQQYRTSTSELAKMAGQFGISPIALEHLVRSYTGSLGVFALAAANPVLRPFSGSNVSPPEKALNEYALVGSLFQPDTGRGAVNAAFDDVGDWAKAAYTFKQLAMSDPQEARAFANKFANEIALSSVGGGFRQQMGELAALKRQIAASPKFSPEEKKAKIDAIKRLEIRLANKIKEFAAKKAA